MATQRVIPGANLPESGSSIGKWTGSTDLGSWEEGTGTPEQGSTGRVRLQVRRGSDCDTRVLRGAAGVMDQVKQEASTRVNEQKVRAAEGLGSVASAIRQASEHLRNENQTLATYADKAVDQIQLFADRMRDKDPAEMVRDAERFARRNPTAFVGGAFVLGLALARFLKSSGEGQYGDRSLVHRDTGFGDPDVTRTGLWQ